MFATVYKRDLTVKDKRGTYRPSLTVTLLFVPLTSPDLRTRPAHRSSSLFVVIFQSLDVFPVTIWIAIPLIS